MGSRRWSNLTEVANKDGDKYFVLSAYTHCTFVSIQTKDNGNMESASPDHGLIVQKESDEAEQDNVQNHWIRQSTNLGTRMIHKG